MISGKEILLCNRVIDNILVLDYTLIVNMKKLSGGMIYV